MKTFNFFVLQNFNFLNNIKYISFQISDDEKSLREQEILASSPSLCGSKLDLDSESVYKVCKLLKYFLGFVKYNVELYMHMYLTQSYGIWPLQLLPLLCRIHLHPPEGVC